MSENQNTETTAEETKTNEENKKSFTDRITDAATKTKEWFDSHPAVKGALCGLAIGFAAIGTIVLLKHNE